MKSTLRASLLCLAFALPLAACVVYEPVPMATTVPASFDRSWNAALSAAQDVGIAVLSADRPTGRIQGRRNGAEVFISVLPQANGSLRVQFDARNLSSQEQGLDNAFTQAYNRRMGR